MSFTFYWHDYETSGTDPALDRPMQFAGVRTDAELNICSEPLRIYCQLPPDVLPHPMACAVTGIAPQKANELGVGEHEFIRRIHHEMAQPGTCSVGYNSIRFDDEFTRFTLYRNFYDAYEREYRNGNSRWDLIDVVRLCCALRPEGINWPRDELGRPVFKLERLSEANGITHEDAHDALSDVIATIELAKLVKARKPRLFDYALKLRNKRFVAKQLNLEAARPIVHVSSKFPSEHYCTSLVLPVSAHPTNSNGVVCVDLRYQPDILLQASAGELADALFKPAEQRTADTPRIPLKVIHLNRSPMVATAALLDNQAAERVGLDLAACEQHARLLQSDPGWLAKIQDVFAASEFEQQDVDAQLYSGSFFCDADRQLLQAVRRCSPQQLAEQEFAFEDPRLPKLLFRYRARNFPASLDEEESSTWREHCFRRLNETPGFGFQAFADELADLRDAQKAPAELLQQMERYAQGLRDRLSAH